MKIIVGMTGSVATTIAPKIAGAMTDVTNASRVEVVMTDKAQMFHNAESLQRQTGFRVYTERDEWIWFDTASDGQGNSIGFPRDKWLKGDPILHVELAKRSSCLVVAPASANTIAKMANGIADNLLTSLYAAWDPCRPVVIAPAMNTRMWDSPAVQRNLDFLARNGAKVVPPVVKKLACGDVGEGALAQAADIAKVVSDALRWNFPLFNSRSPHLKELLAGFPGVPVGTHPGAFGAVRKYDRHCGVDLYHPEGFPVYAVEDGTVTSVEDFTGAKAGCPWWLDTKAVKVEGASGVVCYGEISPYQSWNVGDRIYRGEDIGVVIPVLPSHKHRKDIPGHSCSMLHFQIYEHGTAHKDHDWGRDSEMPANVVDPTPYLLEAYGWDRKTIDMPEAKA